jgi:hypothetical protein
MRQSRNHTATLAAFLLLASCMNDDPQARPDAAPTDGESAAGTTPETADVILDEVLEHGPGRWAMTAFGAADAPMAVLDVPDGFVGRESWVWTADGRERAFGQLAYWSPTRVLADPCDVDKPSPPLGPTVEDLATALAAQKGTATTKAVPVVLDGHRGLYLELSSPAGLDYPSCGPDGGMLVWEAGDAGRVLEVPSTDRYWIMDVGSQRVVISALTLEGATSAAVERVTRVAKSTSFTEAE